MSLLHFVTFCLIFPLIQPNIYLYYTYDGQAIEFYDCIMHESLLYCRRPYTIINLYRDNHTTSCKKNGGISHLMSRMRTDQVNISTVLHTWRSGLEQVEKYSRYLRDPPHHHFDGYLCQCVHPRAFGKNCEYQLPIGTTFDETLRWQFEMKAPYLWDVQRYGNITCYETLECDFGLLCLDWREICDGVQHCMYGYDEYNCDLLELNRCDDNEYRCQNGMCIPVEYFLDGDLDCMDWSDEMPYKKDKGCTNNSAGSECDDRLCPLHEWSCGDGQCISDRLGFQKGAIYETCFSRRDQWYICETHHKTKMWTMPNGRCHGMTRYTDPIISTDTFEQRCEYLLRCALSWGTEKKCPCNRDPQCAIILAKNCSLELIRYPKGAIMGPYGSFLFNRSRDWTNSLPELVLVNGTIQCRDAPILMAQSIYFDLSINAHRIAEELFCTQRMNHSPLNNPMGTRECYRRSGSSNICNDSNTCISISRIRDGSADCVNGEDELPKPDMSNNCSHVQRHRFRCSIHQPTCLNVAALGNEQEDCQNKYDEFWLGTDRRLIEMNCNHQQKDECLLLRQYIEQSWTSLRNNDTRTQTRVSFRSYCDTFWDIGSREDENITECRQWWVCPENLIQCRTGECIQTRWVNDEEWDCINGWDDRQALNKMIESIREKKSIPSSDNELELLFSRCNRTHPFPCLALDLLHENSCIGLDRIGNGEIDCAGAIDERNTLQHCDHTSILGNDFQCLSTNTCIPYLFHCRHKKRCPNPIDDDHWCSRQHQSSADCVTAKDFVCFNGTCVRGSRCNNKFECSFGEDEYMCDYRSQKAEKITQYRSRKYNEIKRTQASLRLPRLPPTSNMTELVSDSISNSTSPALNLFKHHLANGTAFECNRGVGIVLSNRSIVCFCPPQYYGEQCQYHSDRLSILLHLNLSHSIYPDHLYPSIVLKLLLLFLFHNETLMTHEFHVRPSLEMTIINKKMVHFLYSRSSSFRQHRRQRYFNRSRIISSHPYSIRIEIYQRNHRGDPMFVGVWQYPIVFDHFPVYRLAKVLHLTDPSAFPQPNPCLSNPCHGRSECHRLLNHPSRYLCLCPANFSGENCLIEDEQCRNEHCAAGALCKPNYCRLMRGTRYPYCVCPFDRYGERCDIIHDGCQSIPCLNNGSCVPRAMPNQVMCICTEKYYGETCQRKRPKIIISLETHVEYRGVVIQYYDLNLISLDLIPVHQQVFQVHPLFIQYQHYRNTTPAMIIVKAYESHESPSYLHLLSLHLNVTAVDGMTSVSQQNHCPHVDDISIGLSVIQYHYVCINHSQVLCFRDDFYLCICDGNHTRVECFNYDYTLDQCSHCLSAGRCLRGDLDRSNDFVCLCPSCYSGRYCQFNSKSFTFTLDQLFLTDLTSKHKYILVNVIIVGSIVGFILGIPNNFLSFLTLKRRQCLRTGVGNYLLCMSVINQITLGLLAARLIHLSIVIAFSRSYSMIDNVLCKLFSYLLNCSTHLAYWYGSLVVLDRVYTAVALNGQWFKQPHIARRLMVLTFILVFVCDAYELFFVRLFATNEDEGSAMCVIEFPMDRHSSWVSLHQFVSIIHFLLPLLINVCCTATIIVIVIRKKMNLGMAKKYHGTTASDNRRTKSRDAEERRDRLNVLRVVLTEHKEMIARPMITLIPSFFSFFSLPNFIVSFSLGCRNLEASPLRYLLMTFYFIAFIPQLLTFFLYISPSTFLSKEWQSTAPGRYIALFRQQFTSMMTNGSRQKTESST